jgi:hypothetical protein
MMKPSVSAAFLKFSFTAKNSMHFAFNFGQLYVSAQAKTDAASGGTKGGLVGATAPLSR